jgi:septal ring factor EnvC (AmiA/AmiB activator)
VTQNTADRLYLLLVDRLRVIGGTRHAAEDIAAEIDRLAAERDEAQRLIGIYGTSRDAVIAQLGTEIDRLTAERDGLKAALAASWPNLSAQLSEARAEAARLLAEAPPAIAEIARTHVNVTRARRHHDAETGADRNFPAYRP